MIKLKDLLLENDDIFIPRRIEDRQTKYNNITQKEVNTIIDDFIHLFLGHLIISNLSIFNLSGNKDIRRFIFK